MGGCNAGCKSQLPPAVHVILNKDLRVDACCNDQVAHEARASNNFALLKACQEGDLDGVRFCLENNANVETRRPFAMTPEQGTSYRNTEYGLTPLMYASQAGAVHVVEALLRARACVHAKEEDNLRALHFAAGAGSVATCLRLLEYRADPSAKDIGDRDAFDMIPPEELTSPYAKQTWMQLLRPSNDVAAVSREDGGRAFHEGSAHHPGMDAAGWGRWSPAKPSGRGPSDAESEVLMNSTLMGAPRKPGAKALGLQGSSAPLGESTTLPTSAVQGEGL